MSEERTHEPRADSRGRGSYRSLVPRSMGTPIIISTRGVAKVNFLSITQNGKRMCAWLEEVQPGVQRVRPSVAKPFASDRPRYNPSVAYECEEVERDAAPSLLQKCSLK